MKVETNALVPKMKIGLLVTGSFKRALAKLKGLWPIRITMPCGISYVLSGPFDIVSVHGQRMCVCGDPSHYVYKVKSR